MATLSPTSASEPQNSCRVFNKVELWRGVALDPIGWEMEVETCTPYATLFTQITSTRYITPPHNVQLQIGL